MTLDEVAEMLTKEMETEPEEFVLQAACTLAGLPVDIITGAMAQCEIQHDVGFALRTGFALGRLYERKLQRRKLQ